MGWFLYSLRALGRRSRKSRRATNRNGSWIVEDLEGRRLLSHAVQSIVILPNTTSFMIAGPGGDLWVAVHPTLSNVAIDRIGLDGSVTQYPVPEIAPNGGSSIGSLTTGPDGNVWFDAEYDSSPSDNQVVAGCVTPEGQVTEFPPIPVSAGQHAVADYDAMVSGPGGDLWFGSSVVNAAKQSQNFIARVTTAGADGDLWFTEGVGKSFVFGRMSPNGAVTQFRGGDLIIGRVADGPGDSFVLTGMNKELQNEVFQTTTAGALTQEKIPAAISGSFNTYLGSDDGSLWFTNEFGNTSATTTIGQITKHGGATSYDLSQVAHRDSSDMGSMALRDDGNLYVLDSFQAKSGQSEAKVYRLEPSSIP